jgi:hypothetical protein
VVLPNEKTREEFIYKVLNQKRVEGKAFKKQRKGTILFTKSD